MKQSFQDLPEWALEIEKVSANVYEVTGRDSAGHTVKVKGTDADALLEDARMSATKIHQGA